MRSLQSMLVAVDLHPASGQLAQSAIRFAEAFDSRIILFHVLKQFHNWTAMMPALLDQAREKLHGLTENLTAHGVQIEEAVVESPFPGECILQEATSRNTDLIIVGAGPSSRATQNVGAVAEDVLSRARQPVLVVRPGQPALDFRTLLCPVDLSGASERGLRNAVRLARVFGSKLVVLGVVPEVTWFTAATTTAKFKGAQTEFRRKWEHDFEEFCQRQSFANSNVHRELRAGLPDEQIVRAASDHRADLLVMGATGRSGLVRVLLGSTTRKVMRKLPCSLLVVKEEDAVEELFHGDLGTLRELLRRAGELTEVGEYESALCNLRQALVLNPFSVSATEAMATVYERSGQGLKGEYYRTRAKRLQEIA